MKMSLFRYLKIDNKQVGLFFWNYAAGTIKGHNVEKSPPTHLWKKNLPLRLKVGYVFFGFGFLSLNLGTRIILRGKLSKKVKKFLKFNNPKTIPDKTMSSSLLFILRLNYSNNNNCTPIKINFLYLSRDLVEGVGFRFFNLSLFLFFIDLRTLIPPRIWIWSSSSCGSSLLEDVDSSLLEEGSSSPRLRGDRVSLTRDPGKLKLSSLVVALNNLKNLLD